MKKNSVLFVVMWVLLLLVFAARKLNLPSIAVLLSIAFFIVLLVALNDRRKTMLEEEITKAKEDNLKKH